MERVRKNFLELPPFILGGLLFLVPFFWFTPGQIDWGGDSTRIYFFDPYAYLVNHSLFGVSPSDTGGPVLGYYTIPYVILLLLLKNIVLSHTLLISLFHGIKLAVAFLSVYLIIRLLIDDNKKNKKVAIVSGIVGGILYVLSPISIIGWDKVILTHDQFFLNPLVFLLFLLFLKNNNILHLLLIIVVSFIFSHNFSFGASPPIFSFYPLAFTFLIAYTILIKKRQILWLKILFAFLLFILVHAYDFIPIIFSVFRPGSDLYTNIFTEQGKFDRGLSYFEAVARSVKVSNGIFHFPQLSEISSSSFYTLIFPLLMVISFIVNRSKVLIVTAAFFLIVLFFAVGNITLTGLEFYKSLFNLPGFSMFRNFFGQWQYSYIFFYTILSSLSMYYVLRFWKIKLVYFFSLILVVVMFYHALPFIKGEMVNKELWQSNNLKLVDIPDAEFIKAVEYIKNIKQDSKVLVLPLSDPAYQVVLGQEGKGVYQGPALIAYLAGKRDFAGLTSFGSSSTSFSKAVKEKNYAKIFEIFAAYNIGYVFYNSDPLIYENGFKSFPYSYVRESFPNTQKQYEQLLDELNFEKIKSFGDNYHIYRIPSSKFTPHIYVAEELVSTNDMLGSVNFQDPINYRKAIVLNANGENLGVTNEVYKAFSTNPFDHLMLNNHLHNHMPHVSRRVDSLLYPLVVIKEEYELRNEDNLSSFIDRALFLSSKRIFELKMWGDEMDIYATDSLLPVADYYMSWERSLQRLEDIYKKIHLYLNSADKPDSDVNAELVKVNEQLKRHYYLVIEQIAGSSKSDKDKLLLRKISANFFNRIHSFIDSPKFSSEENNYNVALPKSSSGIYDMYIQKIRSIDTNGLIGFLKINNNEYKITSNTENDQYIKFPKLDFPLGNVQFDLIIPRKNYMQDSELNKGITLMADGLNKKSYKVKLSEYVPSKQYLVNFEYTTYGDNFLLYSYLDIQESLKTRNSSFRKNLSSKAWQTEQLIMTVDPLAKGGYIEISNNHSSDSAKISIRNFSLTETSIPEVYLVKAGQSKIHKPLISFKKINPVSYKISVRGASDPYYLVFSEAFNKNWKLIYEDKDAFKIRNDFSYYNGEINEEFSQHFFPGLDLWYGWFESYIADDRHFLTNGYANGWYIKPNDVRNVKDYNLILVYNGQKSFYIGAIISAVFLVVLVFCIYRSARNRK